MLLMKVISISNASADWIHSVSFLTFPPLPAFSCLARPMYTPFPLPPFKVESSDALSTSAGGPLSSASGGMRPPTHLRGLDLVNLVPGLGVILQGMAGVGDVWGGLWDSTAVFLASYVIIAVLGH